MISAEKCEGLKRTLKLIISVFSALFSIRAGGILAKLGSGLRAAARFDSECRAVRFPFLTLVNAS